MFYQAVNQTWNAAWNIASDCMAVSLKECHLNPEPLILSLQEHRVGVGFISRLDLWDKDGDVLEQPFMLAISAGTTSFHKKGIDAEVWNYAFSSCRTILLQKYSEVLALTKMHIKNHINNIS